MGSTSTFRFRDQGVGESTASDTSSISLSTSSQADDDLELQSMTGKGIKHLCSELLELKKASDDSFHRNVYSNYLSFVRIFEEAEVLEYELMELKKHILTQKKLVRDLMNGMHLEVLLEESIEPFIEEDSDSKLHPLNELETCISPITETLDVLLSEHRLDEALNILEMEPKSLQIQSQEDFPLQIETPHKSAISERRKRLADQFALVAEHPRVSAPELQKALSGLCRLGDFGRANLLLLQFYHSRLAHDIHDLQRSKPYLGGMYIWKLTKLVFSMISQAATSFIALYGETSPYASELIQWAQEEIKVFVSYFGKYVKSISGTTGGFSLAVESLEHAISFCSLLESEGILLQPYLMKLIRPCMEVVLQRHINRFKKVMDIFAATDSWVLCKFLLSEVRAIPSHMGSVGKAEYCLLSISGRKFVSMIQAMMEDVSPLIVLQMESSIVRGLADLFIEYIDILERSIPGKANTVDKGVLRRNLAKTLEQQLSLLANSSTLVHFFSRVAKSVYKGIECSDNETFTEDSPHRQFKELNKWILSIQEAGDRLRSNFCQQFVLRTMASARGQEQQPKMHVHSQSATFSLQDLIPSGVFQELFLQLRHLEKLAEDTSVGVDWVVHDLLRELMEAVFYWISNNQEYWIVMGESLDVQPSSNFNQFLLDMHFLVEIARFGEYFTDSLMDASLALIDQIEGAFVAAGLDPNSDILDNGCAVEAAKAMIDKLLEIEKTKLAPVVGPTGTQEYSNNQVDGDTNVFVEDLGISSDDLINMEYVQATNAAGSVIGELQDMEKAEIITLVGSTGVLKEGDSDDKISQSFSNNSVDLGDSQEANAANTAIDNLPVVAETEAQPVEESVCFLVEDSYKGVEETCASVKEGSAGSCAESTGLPSEQVGNSTDKGIKEIQHIEGQPLAIEESELLLKDDSDM